MVKTKKLRELFEVKWLMMRQNPGGHSPYLHGYLLGFKGDIDISKEFGNATTASVKIKVGNGEVKTLTINLSEINNVDTAIYTLNSERTTINNNEFEFEFEKDEKTGRLKLRPTDKYVRFIQIWGDLAAALQFGDCRLNEGKGCYLWASFDGDLKSVAETENWEEDRKIENDSPMGNKVTYTIRGRRESTQIVVSDRIASREAKQMINGGRWTSKNENDPERYYPPVGTSRAPGKVDVLTFSKILDKEDSTEGDEAFVRERFYIGGIGRMARTGGAGSWTDSEYTLTFNTYTCIDSNNKAFELGSPRESDYTMAQWDLFELSGVIVDDWENA